MTAALYILLEMLSCKEEAVHQLCVEMLSSSLAPHNTAMFCGQVRPHFRRSWQLLTLNPKLQIA